RDAGVLMARTARDARGGEPKRPVHVSTTEAQPKAEARGKLESRMRRKCPVWFGGGREKRRRHRPRLRPTLPHCPPHLTHDVGRLIAIRGGFMNSHELNREGRRNVEAELLRRGAASVTSRGTRKIHLHATNSNHSLTVELQVKTKRKGNWHTRTD